MAGGREFDHRRDSTELFVHVVADVGSDESVLAAQQRHPAGDLGEQLRGLGSTRDEDRRHEMTTPEQAAEIRRLADIQVRNIDGTKKVRVTPKVEGLVDPWMYDHKLGRFRPRLFGEWITPGDYTGKYLWVRDDSELYPDDPSRTATD